MSRFSAKNRVTIPVEVSRATGLTAGDVVVIRASGLGRIEFERADDLIRRLAGTLPAGGSPPVHRTVGTSIVLWWMRLR